MSDDHSCDYCKGGMSPCAADPDLWDYESDEDRDTDTAMDKAAQRERAAIVAWLSGQYLTANGRFAHDIAEALRNGEHLRGDDE